MITREKIREIPQLLSGWKEIARYLGMGVRTVQRYERQLGLPVRRPAGKPRGAVVATKSELDAWVTASPIRAAFQLARLTPDSHAHDMEVMKRGIEQMSLLRDQMAALRSDVRQSMASLKNTVLGLLNDLRPGHWEAPFLSVLEDNPQTRRLREWVTMDTKSRKAS
jgi:hypothetical protein